MLNMNQTTDARAAIVRGFADDGFKNHRVAPGREQHMWTCRRPDSNQYAFAVWFGPGVILIWGDLGEYVLRFYSNEPSLEWFVAISSRDYLLGKLKATTHEEPIKAFCYGDAMAHLDHLVAEAQNDRDDAGELTDDAKLVIAEVAHVRGEMADVEHDTWQEQASTWHQAWESVGDWDPPSCLGSTSSALWLCEAHRVFVRLYHDGRQRIAEAMAREGF